MDGWANGLVVRWRPENIDLGMDRRINGCVGIWIVDRWRTKRTYQAMDKGLMDGWINLLANRWINRAIDRMDGWMGKSIRGKMDD